MMGVDLMDDRRCCGVKDFTGVWIHFGKHDALDWEPGLKYFKMESMIGIKASKGSLFLEGT
jgi:hypothetical protein